MKTKSMTTLRFTGSELAAVKEALRLLGLEMRRAIAFDERSIEFCGRAGRSSDKPRRMLAKAQRLAAGGRIAEGTIARAEARAAR
jgi:hypothetical protein